MNMTDPQQIERKGLMRLIWWLPLLDRENRMDLVTRFEESSRWSVDFVVMMGLATALASLGLVQDSTPVVIGAMLVAPLMSPLIGAGFAIVQGNLYLFRDSLKAMFYGIAVGFFIAFLLGYFTLGYELTMEIQARGKVNLIDLGIALVSGMAGAYAMARPNVVATLSGVAIAAALVPPLSVVGISLAGQHYMLAGASCVMFITNLVAIILGAAIVFRLLGVQASLGGTSGPLWTRRGLMLLILMSLLLIIPLGNRRIKQTLQGQDRPLAFPASLEVREAVKKYIEKFPHIEILLMGRSGVDPQSGVHILLTSNGEIPPSFKADLETVVHDTIGNKDTPVRIVILRTVPESPE